MYGLNGNVAIVTGASRERGIGCAVGSSTLPRSGESAGMPYHGAYSFANFGVVGFTPTPAREVARFGINVNAVCPGVAYFASAASGYIIG